MNLSLKTYYTQYNYTVNSQLSVIGDNPGMEFASGSATAPLEGSSTHWGVVSPPLGIGAVECIGIKNY